MTSVSWVGPGVWAGFVLVAVVLILLFPVPFCFTFSYRGAETGHEAVLELSLFRGRWVRRRVFRLADIEAAGGAGRAGLSAFVGEAAGLAHRLVAREERPTLGGLLRQAAAGRDIYARPLLALARAALWTRLSWRTVLGLGDAAGTGLGAGALWAVKGTMAAAARQALRLGPGQPEFVVTPDFEGDGVFSVIEGQGILRVGRLLVVAPVVLGGILRHRPRGLRFRPRPGGKSNRERTLKTGVRRPR